jgi:AhpD family alkylhydroperoxidase
MSQVRGRAILLWQLAIGNLAVGIWAAVAPHSWFDHFPFGRSWVVGTGGAFNEHLVTDVAWSLMALGFLAAWAAAPRRVDPLRGACITLLIFGLPHFVYHLFHTEGLTTGDNIGNLGLLVGAVVIPAGMLIASSRGASGAKVGAEAAGEEPRIPPREPRGADPMRRAVRAIAKRRYGQSVVPIDVTAHSAPIFAGYLTYEWFLEKATAMDARYKDLGALKAASLSGCPFCIDIGSAIAGKAGVTERQLLEMHMHSESDAFDETEKLVLDYAEAMSLTPVVVPEEMVARLRERFDEQQVVELTAAIAFENYRGRFNHALGIGSQNFTAGGACALPATAGASTG